MDDAINRYKRVIERMLRHEISKKFDAHEFETEELLSKFQKKSHFTGFLDQISINLQKKCEERPHPAMMEECKQKFTVNN